uniref:Nuclear receptor domain-containing protein n=1 Tax=Caenorhabditis tropicalis TaxID=1561998 RepID=A0A1I7V3G9_9PELO
MLPICQSCGKLNRVGFNYGIFVCNACKQLIRRVPNMKTAMNCKQNEDCLNNKCRRCSFSRLVLIGANFFRDLDKNGRLFQELSSMNQNRSTSFLTFQPKDLSFEDIVDRGMSDFSKRTKEKMSSHEWASLQMATTVDFMKKLQVVRYLTQSDFCNFAKRTYFKCAIFIMAVESKELKMERMVFPGNIDVFPEESISIQHNHPELFNRIRCQLISKLIELNLTEEEFLLLSVIIASDPNVEGFSDHGKELVSHYQSFISSTLMKYCMQMYGRNGPNRFGDLISLIQILTNTMEKLEYTSTLFDICGVNTNKLVKEFF